MRYIQPKDRNQVLLFSNVNSWISESNPIRLIDLIIDKLVLAHPEKFKWKGLKDTGRKSYSPRTMLKLILYGYLNRMAGSRRLEKETYRNIELLWLLGELHPDHWTICEFRRKNGEQIKFVTLEFRKFLKSEKYISGKVQATDGTKIKAYTSKDMLSIKKIEKRLDKINKKLDEYLEEFKQTDTIEELTEQFENDFPNINLEKALIEKITELQEKILDLEEQKLLIENSSSNYISPNDPEARLMKSRDGKIPAYNGQTMVDGENKLITLSELTDDVNDVNRLKRNVDLQKEQIGVIPKELEADKGYVNYKNIQEVEEEGKTECYIPLQVINIKERDKRNGIKFTYDEEKDEYYCSEGKVLKLIQKNRKERSQIYDVYQGKDCNNCPLKSKCTESKIGRSIHRNKNQEWIDKYKRKMQTQKAKTKVKERGSLVEHPFGTIKIWMGKFGFLLRGIAKAQIEFYLYATAYNLKRMEKIEDMTLLLQKVENYSW